MNINHGWKIHADLVQDQTYDEALASIGRNSDHSIADKELAEAFDKRLNNLGMETDDFLKDFKLFGTDPRDLNTKYVNPNDFVSAMEVFDKNKVTYKMSARTYGEGRHITAYPQNIVDRDTLISDMESTLGHRLVDQNDPAYRARLGPIVGTKNHPLSRGVSGRFTTDYLGTNPDTGKIDFTMSSTDDLVPEDYKISGEISAKEIEKINKVTAEIPEMGELLHGPDGYVSPYRTIEQIADDRVSGVINPSHTTAIVDSNAEYGLIHPGSPAPTRDPLPAINKPGSSPTPSPAPAPTPVSSAAPSVSAPSMEDLKNAGETNPVDTSVPTPSAVATETYDHAADVSKATTTGESLVESPPPKPTGTVTSNAPVSQRRLEALEEMAANGTDAEKEIARKKLEELRRQGRAPRTGPGDLGKPTNIRTTPSAHGADVAAPHAGATTTTAADVVAEVTTDAPKVKVTAPPSSGAPPNKKTKSLLDDAAEAARNVAKGHGNARTLGIVGAATLLGVGVASTRSKNSVQRGSGTYMDESRRDLGY